MAKCSNGIFGPVSGRLGNFVYSHHNGNQYVNLKSARHSNKQSPAQVNHKAKFASAIQFVTSLKDVLKVGFKPFALRKKKGAINMAMGYTLVNVFSGSCAPYIIDYPKVRISLGNLPGASDPKVSNISPLEIEFTWKDSRELTFNDLVFVAVYNPVKQEAVTIIGGNYRTAEKQIITVPSTFAGDEVHCYLAFQNARGTEVSESQYLGSLKV
jgi:hypothetical protein